MKQFIFKFSFFIVIFVLGLTVFSEFLKFGQKNYDSTSNVKLKLLLEEKTIDPGIIIFGSSVAEGAVNPKIISEITGKTVFNAALSGRRILDWNPIAFSFLNYTKNNQAIILDIFPNVFNETDNLYQPHEFYPYLSNKFVKDALAPISTSYDKMTSLPFYYLTQLNSKIILNSLEGVRGVVFSNPSKIPIGYMGFNKINSEYKEGQLTNLIQPKISTRLKSLYEQLFLQAANKNIKVILVGMPVYYKGQPYYNQLDSVYNWGTIWSNEYENVTYINLLNDNSFTHQQSYFANNTHLNNRGASKLSKKIALFLK